METATPIIKFSEDGLLILNIALGFIMFGIALGMNKADFKKVAAFPKPVAIGLFSQFILLPFFTFLLVLLLKPTVGIALGMFLVAACPGGNISNYITYLSKGNIALSITLTSVATLLAVVFTPLNFSLYADWYVGNYAAQQNSFQLDFFSMAQSIATLILIPLVIGLLLKEFQPKIVAIIEKPVKILSMVIFFLFVVIAFATNINIFMAEIDKIFLVVLLHNGVAFLSAYIFSKILRQNNYNTKTITIETGIQNSGLALILIFSYFNGNADMALIAAWWGIWHIVSGFLLSLYFRKVSNEG
jgi:BASS family bile acid:Na+ symporter